MSASYTAYNRKSNNLKNIFNGIPIFDGEGFLFLGYFGGVVGTRVWIWDTHARQAQFH